MAIDPVVTKLRAKLRAKLTSISGGTKKRFLDGFKNIHNAWHMAEMNTGVGTFGGEPIGFLSFHHEVLSVYVAKFAPDLVPGPMAKTSPPYRLRIDGAQDAPQFSSEIEGWHNLVHRNVKKYGAVFADPKKNIYLTRFRQFHKFIDETFHAWLQTHQQGYNDVDHTAV